MLAATMVTGGRRQRRCMSSTASAVLCYCATSTTAHTTSPLPQQSSLATLALAAGRPLRQQQQQQRQQLHRRAFHQLSGTRVRRDSRLLFSPPGGGGDGQHIRRRLNDGTRRWMGSPVGGPPGQLVCENFQTALPNVNLDRLKGTLKQIRKHLGYESYDVTLHLVDDAQMTETNHAWREMAEPTDILSFPALEASRPGKLRPPRVNHPTAYDIGEMLIDVPYVIRQCAEDRLEWMEEQEEEEAAQKMAAPAAAASGETTTTTPPSKEEKEETKPPEAPDVNAVVLINDSDDEEEEEYLYYDDRGVSAAMARVFDPELRLHMLLVHGMLHLVGYDHNTNAAYTQMVNQEELLLRHLQLPTAMSVEQDGVIEL